MGTETWSIEELRPVQYATRQPILAVDETVIGYKLFFRTDLVSHFSDPEPISTDDSAADISSLISLDILADGRLAFVEVSREVLLDRSLIFLPPGNAVLEIRSDLQFDDAVFDSCCDLKNAGYKIALEGFVADDPRTLLAELADFIKIDVREPGWKETARLLAKEGWKQFDLIAVNVDSRESFQQARGAGFQYFQGYFFHKPESMRTRSAPANRIVYMRLLSAVSKPELDWKEIEGLIKSDTTLYYRLLRFINSVGAGLRVEVTSIHQAMALLGDDEIRRWCRLAGMFQMSNGPRSELILSSLVRARFCELFGKRFDNGGRDLFLLGLLSLMDAILEIPMSAVVDGLALDESSRSLLLEHEGELKPVYEILAALEGGIWPSVVQACQGLGLREADAAECYSAAMAWAHLVSAEA